MAYTESSLSKANKEEVIDIVALDMKNGNPVFIFQKTCFKLKDTHREKAPSNKTPVLSKSTNMGICVVGTSNKLFI